MSLVPFKREAFVKDLFQTKYILNAFQEITLESLSLLFDSYNNELLDPGTQSNLKVILDAAELKQLKSFLESSPEILAKSSLALFIKPELLTNEIFFDILKTDPPFSISLDLDDIEIDVLTTFYKKVDSIKAWFSKRKFEIRATLNHSNYKNQLTSLVEIYNKTSYRFFDISLDYESLSTLTFKEFEDLRYRLLDLTKSWRSSENRKGHTLQLSFNGNSKKRIYVDQSFKLYVNAFAKRDGVFLIDLSSLKDEATGEDLGIKTLNLFRAYVDYTEPVKNFLPDEGHEKYLDFLIDDYFNKKMTRSYVFIPTITKTLMLSLI